MSSSSGEEKTEKPTAKKNKENRKEGQVPRTQEIGGWASMVVVALALPPLMKREFEALHNLFLASLRSAEHADVALALNVLGQGMWHAFLVLVLLGAAVMVLGVGGALAQGGFYLATKAMKPKLSKLDPIKGAKRIFGPQAWWEGGKMLIKSALVAILVYAAMQALMPFLGGFIPIPSMLAIVGDNALSMIRNIAFAGLLMGGVDYLITRRRIGKQTKMTKTEVKQEHKQSEGDPMLKGARRSRQLAVSRNRMLADVTNADVVLVNPTHVAVALVYDPEKGAPRVVARGAGVIAAKIRERAAEGSVPMVRDVPLARALHSSTEVGQEIPAELFAAVAQVLAFVISRRSRGHLGGTHKSPRSESELPAVPAIGRRRRTPGKHALAPSPVPA